ncbi:rCG57704, partial [Rattus norvegicus]
MVSILMSYVLKRTNYYYFEHIYVSKLDNIHYP